MNAGVSCSGGSEHSRITWAVSDDRRLMLDAPLTPEQKWALTKPIPGTAPVIACDAHRLLMLLADGTTWRLDCRNAVWRPGPPTLTEAEMKASKEPALLAAGTSCNTIWLVTPDRRVHVWNVAGRRSLVESPVPGQARILTVDPATKSVFTEDGARLQFVGGRWLKMRSPLDADGKASTIKLVVLDGFAYGEPYGDVTPGQEIEVDERRARELMGQGRAALAEQTA